MTCFLRAKENHVLLSRDGPHDNVIKFKAPMCFSVENAETLVEKLDLIFTEIADGKMPQHSECKVANGKSKSNGEPEPKRLKTNGNSQHTGEELHLNGQKT